MTVDPEMYSLDAVGKMHKWVAADMVRLALSRNVPAAAAAAAAAAVAAAAVRLPGFDHFAVAAAADGLPRVQHHLSLNPSAGHTVSGGGEFPVST